MTAKELAQQYAARLRNGASAEELHALAVEIGGLTYSSTGNPISVEDRLSIATQIYQNLNAPKMAPGGGFLKEGDNKQYLELVNVLKRLLGGSK